jgi:hypothetical protein
MNATEKYQIEMSILILTGAFIFVAGIIKNNVWGITIGGSWLVGLFLGYVVAQIVGGW